MIIYLYDNVQIGKGNQMKMNMIVASLLSLGLIATAVVAGKSADDSPARFYTWTEEDKKSFDLSQLPDYLGEYLDQNENKENYVEEFSYGDWNVKVSVPKE